MTNEKKRGPMKLARKLFKGRYLNPRFERKMACCVPRGQLRQIKILLGDARFSPILTKIELDGFWDKNECME